MGIDEIARFAPVKGLNLVGTGDFTHAQWLKELREKLAQDGDTSLYRPAKAPDSSLRFMVTGEVATFFPFREESKKIHHLILTPSLETAAQINDRLSRYGSLTIDGRPALNVTAAELVEEVMEASQENVVIPAHVWTPWFSLFGDLSGFDRIEDCYQDTTRHIFAVETGLSSDPPMNWRLSALDRFALVSNSDSHSSWPWRIGREANVFNLDRLTYSNVVDAIRSKDPKRFLFTIETYPEYGKYHWTGHRNCKVSLSSEDVKKYSDVCPVCHRKLTKGVEQRVDELADRPAGFKPESVPGFRRLLPLSEVIQTVLGVSYPGVQKVWEIYNSLVARFGDEYKVLIDAPFKELAETAGPTVADAILRVREERLNVVPGYDGVYGRIELTSEPEKKADENRVEQPSAQSATRQETRKQTGQQRLADFL